MYDLVIVGAGSGGYEGALYAHRRGMKVALVELSPETVGGNCLNRGCIPSKYMRHGAYMLDKFQRLPEYGISLKGYDLNMQALKKGRDRVVLTIRENFKKFAEHLKIPIFYGKGILKDANIVVVEPEGVELKAKYILLATGSSTTSVGNLVPDGRYIFDTDQIWSLEDFPRRILILGGGAVGVEFAYIFRMYGSEVVLVELKDRLLPTPDIPEESSRYLARKLRKIGVDIRLKTTLKGWGVSGSQVKAFLSDDSEVQADLILLGVGRKPNTEGIGLEQLGIEKDSRGFVKVNQFCQTNIPNIYACGDITSPLMLAHKSMYEAKVAISHMLGDRDMVRNEGLVPKIIYSAYEIASVGLTEDQAEEEGYEVRVGVVSFVPNPKAMDDGENEGFVRLVASEDGKILGCHILGPHAGELLHQVLHLMKADLGVDFLSKAMYSHPSLSESIVQAGMEVHFGPITWAKRH
ncbi:dihydrolipoyl dehydrogenase family protein [Pampinifervens florentissimum]|uniref:dihydrolipoyl dehydrogenase family protein n=1 Tax=Pampinifervens florentissimum TaxID=1632019 RepID=UPI0013B48227|nr:NAD(P)/FAD-dependent oxidoreductase [Hydrogenobacter sp. T-8]QID32522.1 NAD(P)/FAD-dependent oxidoreductase [Hydrogenobacter sp. T-8]